jgi:DNA primase
VAAYGEVLSHSQKYFDYLIERSRALFPARTPEGKVKALNYLLPHIQRVPSRIVRDEWANEISHRLGIESAVLRQELRHAAGSRSASRVNAPAATALMDAERVLIRLMDEHEELTPELLESAIRSLRKRRGEHDLEQLQRKVKQLESRPDVMSKAQLAQERLRLKQAMRSGEITTTEGHS